MARVSRGLERGGAGPGEIYWGLRSLTARTVWATCPPFSYPSRCGFTECVRVRSACGSIGSSRIRGVRSVRCAALRCVLCAVMLRWGERALSARCMDDRTVVYTWPRLARATRRGHDRVHYTILPYYKRKTGLRPAPGPQPHTAHPHGRTPPLASTLVASMLQVFQRATATQFASRSRARRADARRSGGASSRRTRATGVFLKILTSSKNRSSNRIPDQVIIT